MSSEDAWADDHMDRKPSADFLTVYLLKNPHVRVLNVNSPWGAGKSFFLSRWAQMLSSKHVCVTFNAWETDYSAEPLVALVACIEEQVSDSVALESTKVGKGLINTGSALVKRAGPLIVKGLVKKISGIELDELLVPGAEDAVDGVVEALIKDQSETRKNVQDFKEEVRRRLNQAAEDKGLSAPAFIFIDELDRCRPTYAIELLERIKHFFELEDCRFIIASDSVQLAHSIRAVYGQGFASERYLNRFFDAEFSLKNDDIFALVQNGLPEIDSVEIGLNVSGMVDRSGFHPAGKEPVEANVDTVCCSRENYTENAIIVVGLARYFEVALRELVNYIRQIKSAADTIGGKVDFFWLAFLVFYKNSKSESYADFLDEAKTFKSFKDFSDQRPLVVKFSFTYVLVSLKDMVLYYCTILYADPLKIHLTTDPTDWRNNVLRAHKKDMRKLRSYREVVDLAYRLK